MRKKFKKRRKFVKKRIEFNSDIEKSKYLDKLFKRLFISIIILFSCLIISRTTSFHPQAFLLKDINVLKIVSFFSNNHNIDSTITVASLEMFENIKYNNYINTFSDSSFDAATILESGIITKVSKNDGLYEINIMSKSGYLYTYKNLVSFDYSLYRFVNADDILGLVSYNNNTTAYTFDVIITKNNTYYSVYEVI